jgi:glycosyltransferase involved in cell wall biosynthesis
MSEKPRVVIVLGSIPLYGLELSMIDVGTMLRDAGAEVLFVINRDWGHVAVAPRLDALGLPHEGVVFFGGVERGIGLRRVASMLRLQCSESLRMLGILRSFRPTHIHLGTHWDYFNLYFALRFWPASMVFQAGNVPDPRHPAVRVLWRSLLRCADTLVGVSRFVLERFAAVGLRARSQRVIYNRVPLRPLVRDAQAPPDRVARTVFVFVGQISPIKGAHHALAAAIALLQEGRSIECWFLGDLSSAWAGELCSAASVSQWPAALRFFGYVSDPAMWFAAADVHLMPSLADEAYGIVVAEAKSAALPTIAYADGALPELVAHGSEGIVCERDNVDALSAAMRTYDDDHALIAAHGQAAQGSLRRLHIDRVAAEWARLYGAGP